MEKYIETNDCVIFTRIDSYPEEIAQNNWDDLQYILYETVMAFEVFHKILGFDQESINTNSELAYDPELGPVGRINKLLESDDKDNQDLGKQKAIEYVSMASKIFNNFIEKTTRIPKRKDGEN